jgi:hypothetical protein
MGNGKTWSAEECEAAAKAYVRCTHDSVNGSGQKGEEFAAKIHEAFSALSPPGVKDTGTYTDRDPDGTGCKVWHYVRDTIMKSFQKFNASLNAVMNMNLSGVSHQQKINIAVAYFLKQVKQDNTPYDFKDFDAEKKWRLYKACLILKDTAKAAPPSAVRRPSEEVTDASRNEDEEDNEGFLTDSADSRNSTATSLNTTTRGKQKSYKGRDAAKTALSKEEQQAKKVAALADFASTEKSKLQVIADLKLQVQAQNMIAMLSHPSVQTNQALADRMMNKILAVMGVNDENPPIADPTADNVSEEEDISKEEAAIAQATGEDVVDLLHSGSETGVVEE